MQIKRDMMDQKKRNTLMTIGVIAAGYAIFRYAPALIPKKLELEAISQPPGFRRYVAGETSGGSFNPFVGIEDESEQAVRTAEQQADSRVADDICVALYGDLDLRQGQVPIASFSDYYCPYCRIQTKRLAALVNANGDDVAVAWHELPLLGEASKIAAMAALAAKRQGAYVAFHDRLMKTPFVASPEYLSLLAKDLNVDEARLLSDMQSPEIALELQDSAALSRVFAFVGTPALVIGRTVVQGQVSDNIIGQIIKLEQEDGWEAVC
jgi:protein-disulfide isomerase